MKYYAKDYDVIVIGAGHAGIEAGLAAARLGMQVGVFTINMDWVGNLPCNPSIGGTGKGQLVHNSLLVQLYHGIGNQHADADADTGKGIANSRQLGEAADEGRDDGDDAGIEKIHIEKVHAVPLAMRGRAPMTFF